MRATLPVRVANRFKASILILMAIFFAEKYVSGKLHYYISPRFGWLALLAVVLFIALGSAYNLIGGKSGGEEKHHEHADHAHGGVSAWTLVVVALPLILGLIIPAKPLDAAAVSSRGVATEMAGAADAGDRVLSVAPSRRTVLDWVQAMSADRDPSALDGQAADVVGFVYRDARFGEDQILVARFVISCCVADATAIGVVVQSPEVAGLEINSWVRVRGTFKQGELDGDAMPVLFAEEVIPVEPPEQPYLYP